MKETKKCSRCEAVKPVAEFYGGKSYLCKTCERKAAAKRMREYNATLRGKASQALQSSRKTIKRNGYDVKDDLTIDDVLEVMEFFDKTCAYCDEEIQGPISIDHVIPLSKGGGNTKANIVVACMPCNVKKQDKPIAERFSHEKQVEIERYSAHVSGEVVECESLYAEIKSHLSGLLSGVENITSSLDAIPQKNG